MLGRHAHHYRALRRSGAVGDGAITGVVGHAANSFGRSHRAFCQPPGYIGDIAHSNIGIAACRQHIVGRLRRHAIELNEASRHPGNGACGVGWNVGRHDIEELLSMPTIGGKEWQGVMEANGGKIERAINLPHTQYRLRVSAYEEGGDEHNPNIVFRVLKQSPMNFEDTGAPRRLLEMVESGRGLMLITGPTGSGKTTTMASLLNHINMNFASHILTIEDPIEYMFPAGKSIVSQREVGTNVPTFADGLRGAMRQRPNILAIGEVMDRATVDTMLLAAESGHFVIATTHTSSVEDTINRMLSFYDSNERQARQTTLASTLVGVVGQALVPSMKKDRYFLATEVLVNTSGVANMIRKGEVQGIRNLIRQGARDGMQDMNAELTRMVNRNDIHFNDARYASNDPDNLRI